VIPMFYPMPQQPCAAQPEVANLYVHVTYLNSTPASKWGPFTRSAAEAVAAQLAASPQIVHSVEVK